VKEGDRVSTPDGSGKVVKIESEPGTVRMGRRVEPRSWVIVDHEQGGRATYPAALVEPLQEFAS